MAKAKTTRSAATAAGKPRRPAAKAAVAAKHASARRKPAAKAKPAVPAPAVKTARPAAAPIEAVAPIVEAIATAPDHAATLAGAADPLLDIALKGPDMATTTETLKKNGNAATDRVQALFGDVNGRAKTALEKGSKLYEEMVELAKGNVEAIVASSRVAAKGAETIGQEAADYGKASFERASATFRSFATVKSPTELFQLQSEFARTAFDDMVAESSKLSESFLKLAGEIAQPLSSRVALAAEKVKLAAF